MKPEARLVALGQAFRGDDGVALAVAERVERSHGDRVEVQRARGPELLDVLSGALPVVLVDCVRRGASEGAIVELPLAELSLRLAAGATGSSSHGIGAAQALALLRALGRPCPRGWFLGVGGARFSLGAPLSPAVAGALEPLTARVRARLDELAGEGRAG